MLKKFTLLKASLLTSILLVFFTGSKAQFVFTIAGTGVAGYSGDGGLATFAKLNNPAYAAFDKSNNIYISDYFNNCIRKINAANGEISTIAGTGVGGYNGDSLDAIATQLDGPVAINIDTKGNIYFVDFANQIIRKINVADGKIYTVAGNRQKGYQGDNVNATETSLNNPWDITLDSSGNILYIADQYNNRIREVNLLNGNIMTIAGTGNNDYSGDGGLAANAAINSPTAVKLDKKGNIYIYDDGNSRIRRITASDGKINTIIGNGEYGYNGDGGLALNARIGEGNSLAMDSSGDIYFNDFLNNIIRVVSAKDSTIATFAGDMYSSDYNGEGIPVANATFSVIRIALDEKGNLFFTDRSNRVRKITATSTNYNTIKGIIYVDYNNNGIKDIDEPFFKNAKITAIKTGIDSVSYINPVGQFKFGVDTGSYITSVHQYYPYYTINPASANTAHSTYLNTDSVSFALHPIANKADIKINMYPTFVARPGFDDAYTIKYENFGTTTFDHGTIRLLKDARLNFVSANPVCSSIVGDTLEWSYNNFRPLDTASIIINFKAQQPPVLNVNDTLHTIATITPVVGNITPADDTAMVLQIVSGSFDPNYKAESHNGHLTKAQGINGEWLTYTINFQNTGSYKAYNVTVEDTLSNKLDWSTLQIISANHNYTLTVKDNICKWYFENIQLPDSSIDDTGSHGYIVYRIKTKRNLPVGSTINNRAGIYFDYNLAVETNVQQTSVVNNMLPLTLLTFTVQNNGKLNELNWRTAEELNTAYFLVERGRDSHIFESIGMVLASGNSTMNQGYNFSDIQPLPDVNYYRLKMVDKDGKYTYSKIVTVNNSAIGFNAVIYPNPVHNIASLQFASDKVQHLKIEIVNISGKVLITTQFIAGIGITTKDINVTGLAQGTYLVRIVSDVADQSGLKFVKK